MGRIVKRLGIGFGVFAALFAVFFFTGLAPLADLLLNGVQVKDLPRVDVEAERLHRSLTVVDWHSDALLWNRDVLGRHEAGHVDVPRLREGGVAIQAFTIVTKVPRLAGLDGNAEDTDDISLLVAAQRWPLKAWGSLLQRALLQAGRLEDSERRSAGKFKILRTQADLTAFLARREVDPSLVSGILGLEGSHALEDDLKNIDVLFDAGLRMMAPAHFFDNGLGGSAHGIAKGGLTELGREYVRRLEAKKIIIDLAHASPKLMEEVLAMATRPVVVSHTGVAGTCDNPRNLTDAQLRKVAAGGGLVAIGFWDTATCGIDAAAIVKAIRYTANLIGVDHVALGSDFDGTITAPFDARGMPLITEALLKDGFSELQVGKIMGGNGVALLARALP